MNDTEYWDTFYTALDAGKLSQPSPFAKWCVRQLWRESRGIAIDVGCGNGRDSATLAIAGWRVIAIDNSPAALKIVAASAAAVAGKIGTWLGDFTTAGDLYALASLVYARWVIHAIDATAQALWLESLTRLPTGGIVAIEARATIDQDRHVEENGDHYRRYLDPPQLVREISAAGFHVEQLDVCCGLSLMSEDDPLLVRLLARKTKGVQWLAQEQN